MKKVKKIITIEILVFENIVTFFLPLLTHTDSVHLIPTSLITIKVSELRDLAMADDITTRMQKEVGQLQKDMEKMAEKTEQLRTEFRTSMEAMDTEMRTMFEKMVIQMKSTNTTSTVELIEGS